MQEIELKVGNKRYILNNNSSKFDRATSEAGDNASPEEVLAIYDRLGGLIKDQQGNKIENGIFWEKYKRWKEEQPKFIKIIEDRDKNLGESEKQIIDQSSKHIDHKRAFLGTLMTIAAAIIAGLFLLTNNNSGAFYLNLLAKISGFGFGLFIISSASYLIAIFSQESLSIDRRLEFIKNSRRDFVEKVGIEITDIDSYEKYREQKYEEGKGVGSEIKGSREIWFVSISLLFVISSVPLIVMFLIGSL